MSILLTGNRGFIASGIPGCDGIDIKDGLNIVTYKAKKSYDFIIHTAAKISVTESMLHPTEYYRTNVDGTLNLVKQHPEAHFVFLSTAGVYGEGKNHTTNSPIQTTSVYTFTKYLGEKIIRRWAKSWVILRLTNVIGDGERGEPNVYQIFKKAEVLPIFGNGLQTRDFVSVNFVRKVIMDSLKKTGTFNVGSGVSRTVMSVAKEFDKPMKFYPAREGEIRNFGLKKDAVNNITES